MGANAIEDYCDYINLPKATKVGQYATISVEFSSYGDQMAEKKFLIKTEKGANGFYWKPYQIVEPSEFVPNFGFSEDNKFTFTKYLDPGNNNYSYDYYYTVTDKTTLSISIASKAISFPKAFYGSVHLNNKQNIFSWTITSKNPHVYGIEYAKVKPIVTAKFSYGKYGGQ